MRGKGISGGDRQMPENMDFGGMSAVSQASSGNQWIMLAGCAVLLLLAIIFAKFFKSNL